MGWKRISAEREDIIREYLKNEVKTYDQYLTGDVWCYDVVEVETGDVLDSCYGFYSEEYCREEGQRSLEWCEREIAAERNAQYALEVGE